MAKKIKVSDLNNFVRVEFKSESSRDVFGVPEGVNSWQAFSPAAGFDTIPAKIKPVSHSEVFTENQDRVLITHYVYLRYNEELFKKLNSETGRVVEINKLDSTQDSRSLRVHSAINEDNKYWFMKLRCVEGEYVGS